MPCNNTNIPSVFVFFLMNRTSTVVDVRKKVVLINNNCINKVFTESTILYPFKERQHRKKKVSAYHLQVGDADIKTFIHICMPHQTYIGNIKNTKISLCIKEHITFH